MRALQWGQSRCRFPKTLMATTSDNEPTLKDLANKLDKLAADNEKFNDKFDNYSNPK